MKKMVFVLLLVALLLSLALPVVALAACDFEDPYPPGSAKATNDHARVPLIGIPDKMPDRAGFIPGP